MITGIWDEDSEMTKKLSFTCVLVNGVHARPASHIETLCNGFTAAFQWHNTRTGRTADGKSVLSLIVSASVLVVVVSTSVTLPAVEDRISLTRLALSSSAELTCEA